jgi:steroid delta-isomerase-like uncharacterized protein
MGSPLLTLLAAYNDHDARAASMLYRPDGEHHEVANGSTRSGREDLRASLEVFLRAFPDAHWAIEATAVDSPRSVVTYRLTGALTAALGPFEARGQRLDIRGVMVALTDPEAMIARTEDYWDSSTFVRQMRDLEP